MLIPSQSTYIPPQALDRSMTESDFDQTFKDISREFRDTKVAGIDDPNKQLNDIKGLISQIQHLNNTPHADTLHLELEAKCKQLIRYLKDQPCITLKTSLSEIFDRVSPRMFSKQINLIKAHLTN